MAFTATLTKKRVVEGGMVEEFYDWVADSGTTTGNITADTATQPEIVKIEDADVSSNGDTDVQKAYDAGDTVLKLTFTANDSGTAKIRGKAA